MLLDNDSDVDIFLYDKVKEKFLSSVEKVIEKFGWLYVSDNVEDGEDVGGDEVVSDVKIEV